MADYNNHLIPNRHQNRYPKSGVKYAPQDTQKTRYIDILKLAIFIFSVGSIVVTTRLAAAIDDPCGLPVGHTVGRTVGLCSG